MRERGLCPPDHRHGETATCYNSHGCRCDDCRTHMASLEWRRKQYRKAGRPAPGLQDLVPIGPVRAHLEALAEYGIGWKRVAELTGVARATVQRLRYDTVPPSRHPKANVLRETAERILSVKPVRENLAPGTPVSARGTIRRIQALYAIGYDGRSLSRMLGMANSNEIARVLRQARVTRARADQVADLYERVSMTPPVPVTRAEKAAYSRARGQARARGWVPPLAWDDIDQDRQPKGSLRNLD